MSTFAFSHQFSQHWLQTLPAVKNAIIQELSDIATLLQPETDLANYEFSVPKLDLHLDEILTQEKARLAKLQAERQEQERLENERLAKEQLAKEQAENERQEALRREKLREENERREQIRLEKAQLEQQRLQRENSEKQQNSQAGAKEEDLETSQISTEQQAEQEKLREELLAIARNEQPYPEYEHPQEIQKIQQLSNELPNPIKDPNNEALPTVNQVHTPTHFSSATHALVNINPTPTHATIKQEITQNLTQQMEDYIQESTQIMRDDLKIWLESEVEKQLTERGKEIENAN